jgi:hypothetical protein
VLLAGSASVAVMVRTAVPEPVMLGGDKFADTPAGKPLALKATGALKPFNVVRLKINVVD